MNAATKILMPHYLRLREAAMRDAMPGRARRDAWLAALETVLREHRSEWCAAISADFGHRASAETELLEIFPALEAIKHARRHLARWMRPRRRAVSLWFQPGRAAVRYQPLGVVGIIVPWNYPLLLAVAPLVAALAAGNRVLVKMSEYAPATAALFRRLIESPSAHALADVVTIIEGDAEVAQAFAALPLDHLLFTGSTSVGHSVMRAAADNLTPVTLELGGKSPAILGANFAMDKFAERVMIGKTMNAGQTCIAPDYVLVPRGREREFAAAAQAAIANCYPDIRNTPDYSTIINARHFARLAALLDDARAHGAELVPLAQGSGMDSNTRRMPPYALLGVSDPMRIMQEEIFGPLLPVVPYDDLDAAIAYVRARPHPLALYYFDRDQGRVARVLNETLSGGVTINDTILHIAQDNLPFGGVGASGMGSYHGLEGFETFSKKKGVFYQSRLNAMGFFKPPYGRLFKWLVGLLLR